MSSSLRACDELTEVCAPPDLFCLYYWEGGTCCWFRFWLMLRASSSLSYIPKFALFFSILICTAPSLTFLVLELHPCPLALFWYELEGSPGDYFWFTWLPAAMWLSKLLCCYDWLFLSFFFFFLVRWVWTCICILDVKLSSSSSSKII